MSSEMTGSTKSSPIMAVIETINANLATLEEAVSDQEAKLQPITADQPPESDCEAKDTGMSPVALVETLSVIARKVGRYRDRLQALTNRVAL